MSQTQFAIVTGASSGMGLQVSLSLLERGFFVFGVSRSGADIEAENYLDLQVDLKDETLVAELFDEVRNFTDGIHLLVHCAGIFDYSELGLIKSDDFQDIFLTNTLGTFHLYKHLEEFLISDETHAVNLLSLASKKAYPFMSAYCSAEAAKKNFLDSLKKEWKAQKMRITNFFLGAVDTPFWDHIDLRVDRKSMLDVDEVMFIMDTVIDASPMIHFNDITICHIDDEGF